MNQDTLFHADGVLCDIHVSSKKQLFQEMSSKLLGMTAFEGIDIACRDIVSAASERERLGSTGVGTGVALPHARLEGVDHVHAVFARLDTALDYDAIDERPVDLVALLIAPIDAGGAHLRALAKVSRMLRREDMRARLRAAPNAESLFTILTENQAADTAA
ncbi:PTS sugar transporter subunit IIA [Hellea sp.]|nr:PTS sugar transporter subunit IIA [Hellea sp.]